ncbi:carbohydrate ABC transporter permease [Paenibacillus alginolyticus]|jgi:ABC-type glycerol-3-phosphate transport system permease component|uniref:Carbohydrate ABC transporter permease n=1 Tax=Paenibacillus alginolyticus TaxID=59839 RepID=A0ABT4GBC3_9BACL|nr:carbohydrate ABC transporter permease [Paenibacillus alginolyticus]MCY9693473.1 carbohydrate ABC transporter permease [Paenibacillus alginolyticus]MEC0146068.1 carbohydrate ABC transporter permease [Paenibacillus alginolyticus]
MIMTRGHKIFNVFNIILLGMIGLSMVLPLIHIIAQSLSNNVAINAGKVSLWPVGFTLGSYKLILQDPTIWIGFRNSVIITVFGTLINLFMTTTLAYPLSRPEYLFRKSILVMVLFTLIFSAPLIPNYLLVKQLGLLNTLWALMLPMAISAFNLFVMRSFFLNLPTELLDSARIDGCGEFRILWNIVLPLSKPAMATMGIMYAVGHWNRYAEAVFYIDHRNWIPLQVRLREIVFTDQMGQSDVSSELMMLLSPEGIKMAVIVVATIPILCVYPFLQKHFIQGMMVGSVKS